MESRLYCLSQGAPRTSLFFLNLELCSLSRRHSLLYELITLAVATILLDPGSQPRNVTVFPKFPLNTPSPSKRLYPCHRFLVLFPDQGNNEAKRILSLTI